MRSFAVIAISFFTFSTHMAFAKELGGNLDYALKSEGGAAKLSLTNKRADTSVTLTSVAVLLPAEKGKESKQIDIATSHGRPIASSVTLDLGTVSALAQQIAPGKNVSQFKSVSVSDNNSCKNCDSVGFALKISVEYPSGIKQDTLTEAYLHYFVR